MWKRKKEESLKINHFTDSNITLETSVSNDQKLLIHATNSDKEEVDLLDFDVAFYEGDTLLKTSDIFLKNIGDGFTSIPLPQDKDGKTLNPTKIDIKVHQQRYPSDTSKNLKDKLEVTYNLDKEDDKKIMLHALNKSGKTISEAEITVLFYKNDTLVSLVSTYFMNMQEKKDIELYTPSILKNDEMSYIDYDEIKLHVNHAISR